MESINRISNENMIFLDIGLRACKEAETIILDHFGADIQFSLKPDSSPVSDIDISCEKIIISRLKESFPEHNIISEESGNQSVKSEYTWVIDPIDGTKNYIRKIPLFSTLLGLRRDHEIVVGISNAPAIKELLYASSGNGTYLNNQRVFVSATSTIEDSYLSHGNIVHFSATDSIGRLLSLSKRVRWSRCIGDAWSYHLLASGRIDIVVEARVKFWDIAPFCSIIKESGGVITDWNGKEVDEFTTAIAATNGVLHQKVIELLSS